MTETVLVVDDDPAIVRLSARILREAGLHVLEAGSAEQALRTVQAHRGPIHLLVTDVVMPEADGGTLAARLRRERPGIAVIYVTARTPDPSLAAEARQADTLLLHKPLTPAKLVSAVYELLDGSRTSLER